MINTARRILIRLGKTLPFALCLIVLLSYTESAMAIALEDYVCYGDTVILNKPLSFLIAGIFEYDWSTVIITGIISVAIETCFWNKCCILYLSAQLIEKSYFDFEMEVWLISVICTLNTIVSAFFIYKGIRILIHNEKNDATGGFDDGRRK